MKLLEFQPIIEDYKEQLEEILQNPDVDDRTVRIIYVLKHMPTWKSNIFYLYMYYGKTGVLAEKLGVNPVSLSVWLSIVKKEIREWKR